MATCKALLMKKMSGAHAPISSCFGVRAMARQDTAMRRTVHMSAADEVSEAPTGCVRL